jgi:pimeloyl-ACP methyl ester carboxylesterase
MRKLKVEEEDEEEEEEEEELTLGQRVRRIVRRIVALVFLIPFLAFLILLGFRTASFAREFTTRQDAAPGTGRFVKAADLELFVQEAGPDTAPVVVLIHGTGAWSEIWRETMTALADRGFRSVAIDLPPFGFSERPEAVAYDNASQARRILGVLDALALDSVILVGHSFGSRPTMEATFMAPQRIRRLVLVDAALNVGEGASEPPLSRLTKTVLAIAPLRNAVVSATATNPMMTRRLFQKLIYNDGAATDARVNMLQKPFLVKGSTGKLGQWLRWFLAPTEPSLASERERYRTLPMPVLLIWGERDDLTPLPQGEDLATLIPRAELVVLRNTGHIPAVEDPAAFNAALIQFLEASR